LNIILLGFVLLSQTFVRYTVAKCTSLLQCKTLLIMHMNIHNGDVRVMVFNATFKNISVISWLSVLLVEETTDLPQVTDKL
jgi:hypothetical protein